MVNKYPHGDFKCKKCKDRNWIVQCKCSLKCDKIFTRVDRFGVLREFARFHAIKVRDQKGEKNTQWKGGKHYNEVTEYHFTRVPDHPHQYNGYIVNHRLVMEQYLKILFDEDVYIPSHIDVHHIDENKENNSLINLELLEHGEHTMAHNWVDMSGRYCSYPGCPIPNETGLDKENGRPHWMKNPYEEGKYWCTRCYDKNNRTKLIQCSICKEMRKKYKKNICERCHGRKMRDESPIIKCKTEECLNTFHEIDTNGKIHEYCRSCENKIK